MSKKKQVTLLTTRETKALDCLLEQIEKLCPGDEFGFVDSSDAFLSECGSDYLADFGKKHALAMILRMICSELSMIAENYDAEEIFTLVDYVDRIAAEVEAE